MKTKYVLLFLISHISYLISFSQTPTPEYKKYDWEPEPKPYTVAAADAKENTIVEKEFVMVEYIYIYNEKGEGTLNSFYTEHKIIKANTDKGIEDNNKVYISMSNAVAFVDLKARCISKTGKISLLDTKNIKYVEDYEGAGPYKIFAIEGAETGGEIEYIYTLQKYTSHFGREYFQNDNLRKNVQLQIISPSNLIYEAKSYNGFPDFKKDSLLYNKNRISAKADRIEPLKSEKYAAYTNNRARVEYKLAYNTANGKSRVLSWSAAGERYFNIYSVTDKKLLKKMEPLLKEMKLSTKNSDEEKIRTIESYIKTHFSQKKNDQPFFGCPYSGWSDSICNDIFS